MRANCPRYNGSIRSPVALATEPGKISCVSNRNSCFLISQRINRALKGNRGIFACRKLPAMQNCRLYLRNELVSSKFEFVNCAKTHNFRI